MKKIQIAILLILISLNSFPQEFSNSIKVGNSLEIFDGDTIKIYYSCIGTISDSNCAEYVRIGRIDSLNCNVVGKFKDYYIDGSIAMEGNMSNDKLNGICTFYYPNGNIRETGNYSEDLRTGVWKCFYYNGELRLVLNFIEGNPLIESYYNTKGKIRVKNGFGRYTGYFNLYKSCDPFKCSGSVVNGLMEGKWSYYLPLSNQWVGDEYYEKGKFIKISPSFNSQTDKPTIRIQGFVPNENFFIYENTSDCMETNILKEVRYKNTYLPNTFYQELLDEMGLFRNTHIQNQWFLVGLVINNNDSVSKINIYSSKNDIRTESLIKNILIKNSGHWKSAERNNAKVEADIFFSIIFYNDNVIIPAKILHDEQIKWLKGGK
jgi:antitoxin component YwqK of YwqJK toxin-antitoxin module